jgi:hypothetical protein
MMIMMKRQNKIVTTILIAGFSLASIFSCSDYLEVDKYFDDVLTLDSAFTKRKYAEGFLSNAFEVMRNEVCDITSGSHSSGSESVGSGGYAMFASDELLRMDDGSTTKKYQNGEYGAENMLKEDKWKRVYEPVRKATTILNYIDLCKEMTMSERSEVKAQAHFLRGYAYWVLLRQYGPLPLIPESGFDINMTYSQLSVQRNTFDECVDYIAKDFTAAAQNLPLERTSNNIGRPTQGAALAALARLYLYAASPLYNGNTDLFQLRNADGVQLINQKYEESKWARAAAAALDVMNLGEGKRYALYTALKSATTVDPPPHDEYSKQDFPNGWADIDPFESYRQVFNGAVTASKNPEIIFTRPNDTDEGLEDIVRLLLPFSLKGANSIAVTQKQVDAYYMNDGKTILDAKAVGEYQETGFSSLGDDPFLTASISLQYANREPRFYASIAYSGSTWECLSASEVQFQKTKVFYHRGGTDGKGFGNDANYPITGVGMKKYYHPEDALTSGGYILTKFEPAIRYADVLLWYAEAINELKESHTVSLFNGNEITIKRDVEELRRGMKPVRMRAGLPDLSSSIYNDPTSFRTALKRERQIEFFAECKRYYDLRRWKDAEKEENMSVIGCNVDMDGSTTQKPDFYKPTVVATYPKIFIAPAMYLWPIPQYELTRNKKLTQNPGW